MPEWFSFGKSRTAPHRLFKIGRHIFQAPKKESWLAETLVCLPRTTLRNRSTGKKGQGARFKTRPKINLRAAEEAKMASEARVSPT
jgi:hypothetical protein